MTNQLVGRLLGYVCALLLAALVVFTLVASYTPSLTGTSAAVADAVADPTTDDVALVPPRGIAAVPHPVDTPRFETCDNCHALDAGRAMPPNHATFSSASCALCHAFPPPTVPGQASPGGPPNGAPPSGAAPTAGDASASAGALPPQSFGWVTPFAAEAQRVFDLPDACVVGLGLGDIVTGTACSVRQDGLPCVACHNGNRSDAGVRLDNLAGKQDFIDRGYVARFVAETSAKPANVKRLFADWLARGYPD